MSVRSMGLSVLAWLILGAMLIAALLEVAMNAIAEAVALAEEETGHE